MTVSSDFELELAARISWRELSGNTQLVASLIASMPARYAVIVNVSGAQSRY